MAELPFCESADGLFLLIERFFQERGLRFIAICRSLNESEGSLVELLLYNRLVSSLPRFKSSRV